MNYKDIKEKKLFVFDMDGTIYLGSDVFDFAIELINNLRKNGKHILFFTNNASHSTDYYITKLTKLGFEPKSNEILTSGDVTIQYLKRYRTGKKIYLIGTDELQNQFIANGIELSDKADIVVTSFDTTLTYDKLNIACNLIRNGAEYLSTHPDFNCPTENGFIPDSGAISAFVTASTGIKPVYFGKPEVMTINMICEYTSFRKDEICIFGDRLYTDIALGKLHGVTSVLVLTGETKINDIEKASENEKPDFVFNSLADVSALFL